MDKDTCDCISDRHIIAIAVPAVVVITLILLIPCFIIVYYKKKRTEVKVNKEKLDNRKDLQTQQSNDKTMALLTKLLDKMYSQVNRVPADLMGLFTDKLNHYTTLIDEIATLQANALRDMQMRGGVIREEGEDKSGKSDLPCIIILRIVKMIMI